MRLFLTFIILSNFLYACGGSCVDCHPNLVVDGKYDKEHAILETCTSCHKDHASDASAPCGSDCWDCHSVKKVSQSGVIEHKNLQSCLNCHLKLHIEPNNQMNLQKLF